jgi:hypothetical protein
MTYKYYINETWGINPEIGQDITNLSNYTKWDGTVNFERIFDEIESVLDAKNWAVRLNGSGGNIAFIGKSDNVPFLANIECEPTYSPKPFGTYLPKGFTINDTVYTLLCMEKSTK